MIIFVCGKWKQSRKAWNNSKRKGTSVIGVVAFFSGGKNLVLLKGTEKNQMHKILTQRTKTLPSPDRENA